MYFAKPSKLIVDFVHGQFARLYCALMVVI